MNELWHAEMFEGALPHGKRLPSNARLLVKQAWICPSTMQTIAANDDCFFGIETDDPSKLLQAWPTDAVWGCCSKGCIGGHEKYRHLPNVAVLLRDSESQQQLMWRIDGLLALAEYAAFVGVSINKDEVSWIKPHEFKRLGLIVINTCSLATLETLVAQAKAAGVPVWVGEGPFVRATPKSGGYWDLPLFDELDADLQLRELPEAMRCV